MKKTTTGHTRNSSQPAWAFMQITRIPNLVTGSIYLWRLRLIETPWFGVFLHKINEPDNDRNAHNHPWPFTSIILKGGYTEDRVSVDDDGRLSHVLTKFQVGRVNTFPYRPKMYHTITQLKDRRPCWTLVFVGRNRVDWGFLDKTVFVPHDTYISDRVKRLAAQ